MKKNIDSNFAIAIILLVSACLGFAFWLYGFNFDNSINNTLLQDTAKKSEERKGLKNDQSQNLEKSMQYNFSLQEKATKEFDGPHLYLFVETKKEFSCSGYSIQNDITNNANTIEVTLGDVGSPEGCFFASEPAKFSKDLDLSEGSYTLKFHQKDKTDEYSLEISETTVKIEPIGSTFTQAKSDMFTRTPPNLLQADCFYNDTATLNPKDGHCERFFSEIETFADPYIVAEEGRTPMNQFYLFDGEDNTLINLMKKYDREGHYIILATAQGKKFTCSSDCEQPSLAEFIRLEIQYN